jgi:hypothetical protein
VTEENKVKDNQGAGSTPDGNPGDKFPSCSQDDQPHCLLADASVFVGTTSLPAADEASFLNELRGFFANYRTEVARHLSEKDRAEFEKHFYRPSAYWLFGSWDVAFVALIDDFEFPVQTFHQFSPCMIDRASTEAEKAACDKMKLRGFAHRSIVGPCPRWKEDEYKTGDTYATDLMRLARDTFLTSDPADQGHPKLPPSPLVGICQIEVNNSLLIGAGSNLLRCLLRAVKSRFDHTFRYDGRGDPTKRGDKKTHLILLESYSWHELTMLVFSNSYSDIDRVVMQVRDMDLLDMGQTLSRQQWKWDALQNMYVRDDEETRKNRAEWDQFIKLPFAYDLHPQDDGSYVAWDDRSLSSQIEKVSSSRLADPGTDVSQLRNDRNMRPYGTHVVFNTTTGVGFSTSLFEDALSRPVGERLEVLRRGIADAGIDTTDSLCVLRRWMAKAGHDRTALNALRGDAPDGFLLTLGREDFVYPCNLDAHGPSVAFRAATSAEIVELVATGILNVARHAGSDTENAAGLLAGRSTLGIIAPGNRDDGGTGVVPETHSSANDLRNLYAYAWKEILQVFRNLKKLQIPKVVVERVLNAIALYNEGIQDNFLFSSFLELRGYLEFLVDYVATLAEKPQGHPGDWAEEIGEMLERFEEGWQNRFHGGWRLGEISDFNMEFKGGVQQLVSAFHGAFQRLVWYYTGKSDALAVVTGQPGIVTKGSAVGLNMFDIFKPEFFAARAGHEAAETLIGHCRSRQSLTQTQALFDPPPLAREGGSLGSRKKALELLLSLTSACAEMRDKPDGDPALDYFDTTRGRGLLSRWRRALPPAERALLDQVFAFPLPFQQVYADRCNFVTVFRCDHDLYACWMLACFLGDPRNWDRPRAASRPALVEFLHRIIFVMLSTGIAQGDVEQAIDTYWGELSEFGIADIADLTRGISTLAAKLLRKSTVRKWVAALNYFDRDGLGAWELTRDLAKASKLHKTKTGLSQTPRELLQEKQGWIGTWGLLSKGAARPAGHHRELEEPRVEPVRPVRKGEKQPVQVYEMGLAHDWQRWLDLCDTVAVLHAYLRLLKMESGWGTLGNDGAPKRMILKRDKTTGVIAQPGPDSGKYAMLLFDPRGGTFTYDAKFRRQYFMWRCALVMSLCDISEKSKFFQCMAMKDHQE